MRKPFAAVERSKRPGVVSARERAARLAAKVLSADEADAFLAAPATDVPALARRQTDTSIAHALTRTAAAELAFLTHAPKSATGLIERWAVVRENLKASLEIADRHFAEPNAEEPIRMPRPA